jgi:hypothetical protein
MQDFVYPQVLSGFQASKISGTARLQGHQGHSYEQDDGTKEMKAEKQYWYQRHEKNAAW